MEHLRNKVFQGICLFRVIEFVGILRLYFFEWLKKKTDSKVSLQK